METIRSETRHVGGERLGLPVNGEKLLPYRKYRGIHPRRGSGRRSTVEIRLFMCTSVDTFDRSRTIVINCNRTVSNVVCKNELGGDMVIRRR